MNKDINAQPESGQPHLEEFECWCDEHFGEVDDDTAEKAFSRFWEEQQGEERAYCY